MNLKHSATLTTVHINIIELRGWYTTKKVFLFNSRLTHTHTHAHKQTKKWKNNFVLFDYVRIYKQTHDNTTKKVLTFKFDCGSSLKGESYIIFSSHWIFMRQQSTQHTHTHWSNPSLFFLLKIWIHPVAKTNIFYSRQYFGVSSLFQLFRCG